MTALGIILLGVALVAVLVAARADLDGWSSARALRSAARVASVAAGLAMAAIVVTEAL